MKSELELKVESLENQLKKLTEENRLLKEQNEKLSLENDSLDFRIKQELEPRLKREACSYDTWVGYDKSAEACETFESKVEELVDMVKEKPEYFTFENSEGDVVERVLYCIKKELSLILYQ